MLFRDIGLRILLFERGAQYAVAPDDRRFLMIRPVVASTPDKLVVVENWFEELKSVAEVNGSSFGLAMVSVVVSIQMRKMFAEVRKMFSNARDAEQDVRERQASRNF